MVNWLGIEDASATPNRVWLSRERDTDEWKPLRKVDCHALNHQPQNAVPVVVEGGRATADPEFGIVRANFWNRPDQQLTSATWFLKDEEDKATRLIPLDLVEAVAVEDLYQQAVHESSSLGSGLDPLLKEQIPLPGDSYHICIQKDSSHYIMRKRPNGWFGKTYDLQRGYGAYSVEGEDDEIQLGPVRHLVFCIHGIGEAMWSREDVTFTAGLIGEVTQMRLTLQKRQIAEWKDDCQRAKKKGLEEPPPPNRVEFIPILWYDRVHSSSNALMNSLKATTLKTIPALREIANDVIFDVLMYMTPSFCHDVLECVVDQIHAMREIFQKIHPDFAANNGACSLIGHSLGSVICWDLLAILDDSKKQRRQNHGVHISQDGSTSNVGYQQYASEENANQAKNGNWGPSLPKPMDRVLPFTPAFTLFLGSPVGLFLTLRGAHPVFDELRTSKLKVSPFTLPTGSLHNIFHPSDPVAYRIEPLLLAQDSKEIPPPLYLTREGQGVRLHVKALHIGGEIRKSIAERKNSITSFMSHITEQAQSVLQQLEESGSNGNAAPPPAGDRSEGPLRFPLAGRNDRLDYQLQPRIIDNEYVAAVLAHSSYFSNSDVIDYVIDLTKPKEVIDLTDFQANAVLLDNAYVKS